MKIWAALIFAATTAAAQPVRNGPLPGPLPLFPRDNWWNVDVSSAPVDPNSAAFINFIGAARGMHPDFGGDSGAAPPEALIYGMPYVVVSGSQPRVTVTFDYADESDYVAPGGQPGYPIPEEAKTESRWIEGGLPANDPAASGDRHMLIIDRDQRILYELFALHWNTSLSRWEAGSGAVFPLDSNQRRPDGWTSADAAGLAILPGLIRYDEVFGTAPIAHAFRVTVRATNGYVYPASHRAGSTAGALPMGARLRLKAAKDISGFPEPVRRIFQAMKTHGLIVSDNGSDLYVTGTYDTRWNNDVLNPAFRSIKATDLEVIQLGWKPADTPPCMVPVITMQPAGVTITSGNAATLSVAVAGTPPHRFQWYEGIPLDRSRALPGANTSSLVVTPRFTTPYWVDIEGPCGSAQSAAATVTVITARRRTVRH